MSLWRQNVFYAAAVKMQLTAWDVDPKTSERVVRDIKEQEIFFCDLPVMVDLYEGSDDRFYLGNRGTFLINGVDRVVVSQMHRSPGVVFTLSRKNRDFRGNPYHIARIIPARGSWLDFEFDNNDILWVRIDKKKKILVTTFLQALGLERDAILPYFYHFEDVYVQNGEFFKQIDEQLIGSRLEAGVLSAELEASIVPGQRITKESVEFLKKNGVKVLPVRRGGLINRVLMEDVVDAETGEIIAEQGQVLTEAVLEVMSAAAVSSIRVIQSAGYVFQPTIALTLAQDEASKYEEAVRDVCSKLRPGDVAELPVMEEYLKNLFFNPRFYDLSRLGRIRTNRKLSLAIEENVTQLTREDILATIKYLIGLKERGEGELDDIDHLGNRCVRLVGELLQSQVYVGFARIERIVRERFRLQEHHTALMPYDFLNVKPLTAVLREFFDMGQLSQFMDQTNALSEIAHKRRLSALGPGGIQRDRATFEVRDVHTSHYGRICPIETPEGQNIGLISSLSTYARVNELGFIEATYRPVVNGRVQDDVVCLNAFEEENEYVAQATVPVNANGTLSKGMVLARKNGNIVQVDSGKIRYIDASPKQLFSVATALIPFLEHDDVSRALMGSNMQRQAVPLIKCEPPLLGTGIELELGSTEGGVIHAKSDGVVEYVTADKIVVRLDEQPDREKEWFGRPLEIYNLKKYGRSNHNTWIHQTPIVKVGDRICRGDVITNGPAIVNGELSLGANVLVAFMPWRGYNFEDAIVLSRRLVSDDTYTSIHVEEFSVEARDTKLGPEEITEIFRMWVRKLSKRLMKKVLCILDHALKPGDILVGKVTLKGDINTRQKKNYCEQSLAKSLRSA